MVFSCFQKNNIPKDYKIPLDYIPRATVSSLCIFTCEQTHESERSGSCAFGVSCCFLSYTFMQRLADLATIVLRRGCAEAAAKSEAGTLVGSSDAFSLFFLPGWDVLGKIERLLLGEQFTQFIAYVWEHLIQQKRFKHIHQNVPRAALQFGACGKFTWSKESFFLNLS